MSSTYKGGTFPKILEIYYQDSIQPTSLRVIGYRISSSHPTTAIMKGTSVNFSTTLIFGLEARPVGMRVVIMQFAMTSRPRVRKPEARTTHLKPARPWSSWLSMMGKTMPPKEEPSIMSRLEG